MKLLRPFACRACVLAITTVLCMGGVSAPADDKVTLTSGEGTRPLRADSPLGRPERPVAIFTSSDLVPRDYALWHIEFQDPDTCKGFNVEGAYPVVRFQKWADVLMRLDDQGNVPDTVFKAVKSAKGYVWHDEDVETIVPPPREITPAEKTRQLGESIVRGGVEEVKGQGVIVAVLDSGVDFRHPDFINYDQDGKPTSRIMYFWDTVSDNYANGMGQKGPLAFPTQVPIGTLYTAKDLTDDLRARHRIHVWDPHGHGTACAGIAAGNGNGAGSDETRKKEHMGVAPLADVIAIRIGDRDNLRHSGLLGAICDWLETIGEKEQKPIVLSCSFGGQNGGRDGNNVLERQIDARFGPQAKNPWCRAICIAAGNEGLHPLHAAIQLGGENSRGVLKWQGRGWISIYLDADNLKDIRFGPPQKGGNARNPPKKVLGYIHGITHKGVLLAVLEGSGEFGLYTESGKTIKADAFMNGVPPSAEFDVSCAAPGKQIASPGTAREAITVGSYDFNSAFHWLGQELNFNIRGKEGSAPMVLGALSAYSNAGPRRLDDSVTKPDIVAPGRYFTAAAALNTDMGPGAMRDSSGSYCRFSGTSAATPYAAGVVALMLAKNKNLTNAQIKDLLARSSTKEDPEGKPLDRKGWGNGKLDLKAVTKILQNVPAP